jgi:hypothetical protein
MDRRKELFEKLCEIQKELEMSVKLLSRGFPDEKSIRDIVKPVDPLEIINKNFSLFEKFLGETPAQMFSKNKNNPEFINLLNSLSIKECQN